MESLLVSNVTSGLEEIQKRVTQLVITVICGVISCAIAYVIQYLQINCANAGKLQKMDEHVRAVRSLQEKLSPSADSTMGSSSASAVSPNTTTEKKS
jgi:hypothetical protein